ncbi:SDR family oxidoreductase [Mesorhizobium sp. ES1-3]|uniref:SDR family oxidoreductase n=1 Tax=Mesorhizobium sp. ES1-3 TaxID=2876628 RepID=UPI001CCD6084|nr:SDR family oxidoreductase [Mesorhizobium sp. ES1-3]MBZ9673661.1 SDR family oxidoreductase [Mesorhizobium sp. ES1-3]
MTWLLPKLARSQTRPTRNSKKGGFDGKVVVVTGASAGVGRAVARRFAQAGASVALIAREAASLAETRAEIERGGTKITAIPADVADPEAVFKAIDTIEAELGPVDIWINNAMVTLFSPVAEMTPEEIRRVTEVTYLGFVYGTMAALARMRPRNSGLILQVGSALAYRGIPLQAAYCGAKHAIRGFTDALRTELLHDGSNIRVTMVQLPAVNSPQFDWARIHVPRTPRPVAPVFQPEAIAAAILEAAQDKGPEYWLGSSTIKAIIGSMIFPSVVDRYLARTGFSIQQTDVPAPPGRHDNLFESVPELHRTRGSFGQEAAPSLSVWSASQARAAVLGAAVGIAAIATAALLSRSKARGPYRIRYR